jgi:hypothetical protein
MVFMLSPNVTDIVSIDQELVYSIQFQSFLMAYSKTKLKGSGCVAHHLVSDHYE